MQYNKNPTTTDTYVIKHPTRSIQNSNGTPQTVHRFGAIFGTFNRMTYKQWVVLQISIPDIKEGKLQLDNIKRGNYNWII